MKSQFVKSTPKSATPKSKVKTVKKTPKSKPPTHQEIISGICYGGHTVANKLIQAGMPESDIAVAMMSAAYAMIEFAEWSLRQGEVPQHLIDEAKIAAQAEGVDFALDGIAASEAAQ
jgi:hypothetical protein